MISYLLFCKLLKEILISLYKTLHSIIFRNPIKLGLNKQQQFVEKLDDLNF